VHTYYILFVFMYSSPSIYQACGNNTIMIEIPSGPESVFVNV
jgi:hypothetical protein